MSDEIHDDRAVKRKKPTRKEMGLSYVPCKIHLSDRAKLDVLLRNERMRYQDLFDAAIEAFIRGDPGFLESIENWRALSELPKGATAGAMLSRRERQELLAEIEANHKRGREPEKRGRDVRDRAKDATDHGEAGIQGAGDGVERDEDPSGVGPRVWREAP